MIKIGYIQLMSCIIYPRSLSSFFDSKDVDWRFLYWPEHISAHVDAIQCENLGKSFRYNRFSPRYKDIAWNKYDVDGDPITTRDQVDEDSWNFYSHKNEKIEYMDYHEIRIINEPWGPCSVDKRIGFIKEWVNGCDFILLDITDCMNIAPERILDAINSLLHEFKDCNMKVLLLDYVPLCLSKFRNGEMRNQWTHYIEETNESGRLVYISPKEIGACAKERGRDLKFPDVLSFLSDYYNERLMEIFSQEIGSLTVMDS